MNFVYNLSSLILFSIYRLLLAIIRQLNQTAEPNTPLGTVLVMLPSYNAISALRKQIIASLAPVVEHSFATVCLYPHLPNNELDIAVGLLNSVEDTQVRVILSTFTLDNLLLTDIRFVINAGVHLLKVQSSFPSASRYLLVRNQSSEKINEYRHYRDLFNSTGGNHSVYFYNLYSRNDLLNKDEQDLDDSDYHETESIYQCICTTKNFYSKSDQKIEDTFAQMVSRPSKLVIDTTVSFLKVFSRKNFLKLFYIFYYY